MKFIRVIVAYLNMAFAVFWTGKKAGNRLIHRIDLELGPQILTRKKAQRMSTYAMQCYMSAYWFCKLRNKQITQEELERTIILGAFASTIDDINDNLQLTFSEILAIIASNNTQNEGDFLLAQYLYEALTRRDNIHFHQILSQALKAQDDSIKMLQKIKLTDQELEEISRDKGGLFMLLYRVVLDNPLKTGEAEAIMTLGYVMQLADDMFDIYEDRENNQQTLLTNSLDIEQNRHEYNKEISIFIDQFIRLEYPRKAIKETLLLTSTVIGRGIVCANQLRQLADGKRFDVFNYTRKELICDMEKPSNLLASFRYSLNFYNEINQKFFRKP